MILNCAKILAGFLLEKHINIEWLKIRSEWYYRKSE
jgi:hypothetical protein